VTSLAVLLLLLSQDLLEREKSYRRSLSPAPDLSSVKPARASVNLGPSQDFACGSFDLKSSFRSLFDRNVKEEFLGSALGALQGQLAGSALVLACYASPTVCDALKHYRASANAMLGMELDACRSVEHALGDPERQAQARAVKECLDQKARAGIPLDQAQRACARAAEIRGLDGRPVREIDLRKDLGLSSPLVPDLKIGAGVFRAESCGTAVVEAYEARRKAALETWDQAVRDPGKAPADRLGGVTRAELEEIAAMEPAARAAAVRSVAAAQALSGLVTEAHEAERKLESAELLASPEVREEIARRRTQLRNEMGRLAESFEAERRLNEAVASAGRTAHGAAAVRARERLAERRWEESNASARDRVKPWGCEVRKGANDEARR
jgi:hypothetical protein